VFEQRAGVERRRKESGSNHGKFLVRVESRRECDHMSESSGEGEGGIKNANDKGKDLVKVYAFHWSFTSSSVPLTEKRMSREEEGKLAERRVSIHFSLFWSDCTKFFDRLLREEKPLSPKCSQSRVRVVIRVLLGSH